jgi:hypothetical protein
MMVDPTTPVIPNPAGANRPYGATNVARVGRAGASIYLGGLVLWGFIWYISGFFADSCSDPFLLAAWVGGAFVLTANAGLVLTHPVVNRDYEVETNVIEFVERHAYYLIAAISCTIVAVTLYHSAVNFNVPTLSIDFTVGALAADVGAVFPLIWIPSDNNAGLAILRHIKTVPFTYSVFLYLSSVIAIYQALR